MDQRYCGGGNKLSVREAPNPVRGGPPNVQDDREQRESWRNRRRNVTGGSRSVLVLVLVLANTTHNLAKAIQSVSLSAYS